jgi:putative ABC transport system permease protein
MRDHSPPTITAGATHGHLLSDLWQDLRYAVRTLRKQPAFTLLAVLALALGIGATTSIFSVIQNVLLDPFPYVNADRVVAFQIRDAKSTRPGGRGVFEVPEFLDYQEQITVFEEVVARRYGDVLYSTREGTERFGGGMVSGNTFRFLGVPAALGRTLTLEDAEPGAPAAFLMSHKIWISHFNGDPGIVGKSFILDGLPTTLVGIMPKRFTYLGADLWKPVLLDRAAPEGPQRYSLMARLKPGATLAQAESQVSVIAQGIAKQYPKNYPEKFTVKLVPWVDEVVGQFRTTLYTLAAAVGLLLLIACTNVANMLLSRAASREKELAIRAALGAGRRRVLQQLLVESFLLALLGALVGCFLSYFGLKAIVTAIPQGLIPREAAIRLNPPVLLFSLGIAVLTSVLFGLVPALQTARRDLVGPLRGSGKGTSSGAERGKLSGALVVAEVALSLVLLAGAGLLMRSFVKLQTVDLGLNPENVLAARLPLPRGQYQSAAAKQAVFRQMLDRVQALPGVVSVSTTSSLPPYGGIRSEVEIAGKTHSEKWEAIFQLASEGYFQTLGLRLLRGRLLTEAEVHDARKVAVVNEALVEKYFGHEDALGRQLTLKMLGTIPEGRVEDPVFEIVGVVADAKNQGLQAPIIPEAFIAFSVTGAFERGILVRTASAPLQLLNAVRREIWAVDRNIALTQIGSLTDLLKQYSYAEPRFSVVVLGVFAGVGLVLVALGVYSVIAYRVSRQTRDIGIRMALGATRSDVLRMVLRAGLRLIGAGIAVGVLACLAVTRVLSHQLFGVEPHDAPTLLSVVAVVVVAGLAACYFPARRAMSVDPIVALRSE